MDVILIERITKLGRIGDTVKVRDGFARNYLLSHGKALRASEANIRHLESRRSGLESRDQERKASAITLAERLAGRTFTIVQAAGDNGHLYGSVTARDIRNVLSADGIEVGRDQIELNGSIKIVGLHDIALRLHAEVETSVEINVARSLDEAERQARGEDIASVDAMFDSERDREMIG